MASKTPSTIKSPNSPPARRRIWGDKIPGLKGRPVFKKRMKYGNLSKRNGPRVIYYYDDNFLIALFIYLKSDRADIP